MGSAIKSLTSNFNKILQPLSTSVLKSVSSKAIDMLADLAKSSFDGIKNNTQSLVSRLPNLAQLAARLLGPLFDGSRSGALGGFSMDAIQKLLSDILAKLEGRPVAGTTAGSPGSTVTTPALDTRAATASNEQQAIMEALSKYLLSQGFSMQDITKVLNNSPVGAAVASGNTAAVNNAASAATAAANAAATATTGTATGRGRNIEDAVMDGSAFNNIPAEPVIDGTEDEKTLAKKQAQLQKYARMMQAITMFLQASHDMKKRILDNYRV